MGFTPELTFGQFQSGMYDETPSILYRTIRLNSFTPASLFTGGFQGGWYDPSDLTSMFQDTAGTVPAVVNSAVARINDKSGNGNHLLQATGGLQPVLRQTGALLYLDFDGTDDRMDTAGNVNLSSSGLLSVFMGVTLDVGTTQFIACNGAGAIGGAGGFRTTFNAALAANAPCSGTMYDGTVDSTGFETTAAAAPRTRVYTVQYNYAGVTIADEVQVRANGAAVPNTTSGTGPCPSINFANSPVSLGDIAGSGLSFNGRVFGFVLVGKTASPTEVASTEAYLNGKTQAY